MSQLNETITNQETKLCKLCLEHKDIICFAKNRRMCKHCVMVRQNSGAKEIKRKYYYKNQERLLEYKRNFYLNKKMNSAIIET